jgi:hypothetical protein
VPCQFAPCTQRANATRHDGERAGVARIAAALQLDDSLRHRDANDLS